MRPSVITYNQKRIYGPRGYKEGGRYYRITATVRYDDECKNGHNTFAITADVDEASGGYWREYMGGCCHEEVAKHFPELAPYIKWHLFDSTGPMHYIENTMYWLGWRGWCDGKDSSPPKLEYARSTAVWPDMPESFVAPGVPSLFVQDGKAVEKALKERLPALLEAFQKDVEALGFVF